METIKPGGTSMVAPRKYPEGTAGAVDPDDVGRPSGPGVASQRVPVDRGAAGDQAGDAARLGDPGRDRCRRPAGHDDGGGRPARRARAGGSRAAPSKRDPALGIGLLRGGARPPLPLIVDYIEEHRDAFGVEPICTVLSSADVTIAPRTYYAARTRPPSARAVRDEDVTAEISRVHEENYGVYGVRKVHAQLGRDGGVHARPVARCTVQRLMKAAGLRGISRRKSPQTTLAGLHLAAHRPRALRPRDGPVDPPTRRPQRLLAGAPLRPRRAVRRGSLHRAPGRGRHGRLRGQQGRLV